MDCSYSVIIIRFCKCFSFTYFSAETLHTFPDLHNKQNISTMQLHWDVRQFMMLWFPGTRRLWKLKHYNTTCEKNSQNKHLATPACT